MFEFDTRTEKCGWLATRLRISFLGSFINTPRSLNEDARNKITIEQNDQRFRMTCVFEILDFDEGKR